MSLSIKPLVFGIGWLILSGNCHSAAWVDGMENPSGIGNPGDYLLIRPGEAKSIPVAIFTPLQKGDCIKVTQPGAILWIGSDSAPRRKLTDANTSEKCFNIGNTGRAPNLASNLIAWAGEWLSVRLAPQTHSVVSTVTRGIEMQSVTVPLASYGGLRMVAGRRPLHFEWQGGHPPYSVRVLAEDGKRVVASRQTIREPRFRSDPVALPPGIYRIEIRDAEEELASQRLDVVPAADLPAPPPELKSVKGSKDLATLLEATSLASRGHGWAFEAYQTAAELGARYQPAKLLQKSLGQGDMPPPMRP
jgi:hypothetical protein